MSSGPVREEGQVLGVLSVAEVLGAHPAVGNAVPGLFQEEQRSPNSRVSVGNGEGQNRKVLLAGLCFSRACRWLLSDMLPGERTVRVKDVPLKISTASRAYFIQNVL